MIATERVDDSPLGTSVAKTSAKTAEESKDL
jgi:hypothetical protein